MAKYVPWLIATALAAMAYLTAIYGPKEFGFSASDNATISGALAGSFLGAAGALIGLLIADWSKHVAEEREATARTAKAKLLITVELVNVAMGLIESKRMMDIAIRTVRAGGTLPTEQDFTRELPRDMPYTDQMAREIIGMEDRAVDALVTLKSNLGRTREGMMEITLGRAQFGEMAATSLSGAIGHDMRILADCFVQFAPDRKFKLNETTEPELVSTLLRRIADEDTSRLRIGISN